MNNKIICGNAFNLVDQIPEESIDLILTSPPYYQARVYTDLKDEIGREEHPLDYVTNIYLFFVLLKRKLKKNGNLLLNIGDTYFGTKGFCRNKGKYKRKWDNQYSEHNIPPEDGAYLQHKQLLLIPSRIATKLQDSGYILRNDIIWEKTNAMPSFSPDRKLPVYEHIFHFIRSKSNYYDIKLAKHLDHEKDIIRTSIEGYKNNHFATFPEKLISPFINIYCPDGGLVLDPFVGSGTTAVVAKKSGRDFLGFDISKESCDIARNRLASIRKDIISMIDEMEG